jgi:hypothetical protein
MQYSGGYSSLQGHAQSAKETKWQNRAKRLNPYPVNFVGQAFLHHEENRYLVAFIKNRDRFIFYEI